MTQTIVLLALALLIFASTHFGPTTHRVLRFACAAVVLATVAISARTQYLKGKFDGRNEAAAIFGVHATADASDLCNAFENKRCGKGRLLVQGKDGLQCCQAFIEGIGVLRVKDGRVWYEQ